MGRFDDWVVLITGGARDKGRSHALAFAREGADVVLFDLVRASPTADHDLPTPEELEATRKDVEATGRRCLAIQGDLRDIEQLDAAIDRTVRELGRLDLVVAKTGIFSLVPAAPSGEAERSEGEAG